MLILLGCSKTTVAPAPAASTPAPVAALAPSAPDPKAGLSTAVAFMTALQAQTKALDVRPPIARYNAETDPITCSVASTATSRRSLGAAGGDGSIEVFPNLADAKARAAYIDTIGKASPALGDGYGYFDTRLPIRAKVSSQSGKSVISVQP